MFVSNNAADCDSQGWGYLNGPESWVNIFTSEYDEYQQMVFAHELGHNFGLHHANGLECTANNKRVTYSQKCESWEYADPYDVMGVGYLFQTSAVNKYRLGWLDADSVKTVDKSGTFTLAPSESDTGVRALRIPQSLNPETKESVSYYLDYRQPIGFDAGDQFERRFDGVFIRLTVDPESSDYDTDTHTHLLDTTASTGEFEDALLRPNQSFSDPQIGLKITTLSVSAAGAKVKISLSPTQPKPLPKKFPRVQGLEIGRGYTADPINSTQAKQSASPKPEVPAKKSSEKKGSIFEIFDNLSWPLKALVVLILLGVIAGGVYGTRQYLHRH